MKPSIEFRLSEFEAQDRSDVWRSFTSGVYESAPVHSRKVDINAHFAYYRLGPYIFETGTHSGNRMRRRTYVTDQEQTNFLVLRMDKSTPVSALIEDRSYTASPYDFFLYDYNQNIELKTNASYFVSFRVPYSAIDYDPSKHNRVLHVPRGTSIGRVLQTNLEMLEELVPASLEDDNLRLADGFASLLRSLVARQLTRDGARDKFAAAREVTVRRYIKSNLGRSDLGAVAICRDLGVSRAVLYRIFEAEGGVQRAIMKMRLSAALTELKQSQEERGVIGRVASKWGFPDQAHFSRRFREAFGVKPSDTIGASRSTQSTSKVNDLGEYCRTSRSVFLKKLYEVHPAPSDLCGS